MPKYRVHGTVTGGKYIGDVEAKDEKEAREKAWQLDGCYPNLCHQCASECEDAEVTDLHVEFVEDE